MNNNLYQKVVAIIMRCASTRMVLTNVNVTPDMNLTSIICVKILMSVLLGKQLQELKHRSFHRNHIKLLTFHQ